METEKVLAVLRVCISIVMIAGVELQVQRQYNSKAVVQAMEAKSQCLHAQPVSFLKQLNTIGGNNVGLSK